MDGGWLQWFARSLDGWLGGWFDGWNLSDESLLLALSPYSGLTVNSPLYGLLILAWMVLMADSLAALRPTVPAPGHRASIHGLRGLLACSVFLSHSIIWHYYLITGGWNLTPSHFYTHLGQTSVSLFFMITGFLFFSRILSTHVSLNWARLFVERLFRLLPVYTLSILLMFVIVMVMTGWRIRVPMTELFWQVLSWLFFTVPGAPAINAFGSTGLITAYVAWTLVHEVYFYACLPLASTLVGRPVPWRWLLAALFSAVAYALFLERLDGWMHPLSFLSGMVCAVVIKHWRGVSVLNTGWAAAVAVALMAMNIICYSGSGATGSLLLSTLFFLVVASGNSLGGVLTHAAFQCLGSAAYGIYLFHGMMLFLAVNSLRGLAMSSLLQPAVFWLLVMIVSVPVVLLAWFVHHAVEAPMMRAGRTWARRIT